MHNIQFANNEPLLFGKGLQRPKYMKRNSLKIKQFKKPCYENHTSQMYYISRSCQNLLQTYSNNLIRSHDLCLQLQTCASMFLTYMLLYLFWLQDIVSKIFALNKILIKQQLYIIQVINKTPINNKQQQQQSYYYQMILFQLVLTKYCLTQCIFLIEKLLYFSKDHSVHQHTIKTLNVKIRSIQSSYHLQYIDVHVISQNYNTFVLSMSNIIHQSRLLSSTFLACQSHP
eukprot:TRINITY_DN1291_c0_g1_i2.p1 TRINITY_DN1291_c0_g1~~TRINITY_DN1291_c0_g1_i2.p1  ORF type:complete len:229 (+),score=-18.07 TRINITY_DN1291_c0_g1_i2:599-1285(+)